MRYALDERETVRLNGWNHALCYRAAEDARQVKECLLRKFKQEALILVAHSWGTALGTLLCSAYPEGIAAYLGSGQIVNTAEGERLSYEFVCREAALRGDAEAVRELQRIGAPENGRYSTSKGVWVQRKYVKKYGGSSLKKSAFWRDTLLPTLRSRAYTLPELYHAWDGNAGCIRALWDSVVEQDFTRTVTSLPMPVCLLEGRHDKNTPPELAMAWLDALAAPRKQWAWLERSAHSPMREEPEAWRQAALAFLNGQS